MSLIGQEALFLCACIHPCAGTGSPAQEKQSAGPCNVFRQPRCCKDSAVCQSQRERFGWKLWHPFTLGLCPGCLFLSILLASANSGRRRRFFLLLLLRFQVQQTALKVCACFWMRARIRTRSACLASTPSTQHALDSVRTFPAGL